MKVVWIFAFVSSDIYGTRFRWRRSVWSSSQISRGMELFVVRPALPQVCNRLFWLWCHLLSGICFREIQAKASPKLGNLETKFFWLWPFVRQTLCPQKAPLDTDTTNGFSCSCWSGADCSLQTTFRKHLVDSRSFFLCLPVNFVCTEKL